jgi:hypothetical protein
VKRRQEVGPAVPERLARFVASEWAGEEDPLMAWHSARFDYAVETYPGPLGSPIDRLRDKREAKLRRLRGEL